MNYLHMTPRITKAELFHVWRDRNGIPCASVHFAADIGVTFTDPAVARAVAGACLEAAEAMESMPASESAE